MKVFIQFENCFINLFPVKRIEYFDNKIIFIENKKSKHEFDLYRIEKMIIEDMS